MTCYCNGHNKRHTSHKNWLEAFGILTKYANFKVDHKAFCNSGLIPSNNLLGDKFQQHVVVKHCSDKLTCMLIVSSTEFCCRNKSHTIKSTKLCCRDNKFLQKFFDTHKATCSQPVCSKLQGWLNLLAKHTCKLKNRTK